MQKLILISILIVTVSCSLSKTDQIITTASLLDEMVDLNRLTRLPDQNYRTVQFSSYDRRSTKATDSCWFANEDGFGNEPIPGFEKVLKEPDANGIGEYLICDIQNPGAILRLWTAAINGKIRLFIDDVNTPVYEGPAQDFFWNTIEALSGNEVNTDYSKTFRQFDAVYLPIPFAKRCRIEWIGNIKETHFYHVGVRIYDPKVKIESFNRKSLIQYATELKKINTILKNPAGNLTFKNPKFETSEIFLPAGATKEVFNISGEQAIEYFSIKINAKDLESVLRKTLLNIYFDNSSVPLVQSPIGDFFGSAPDSNPYQSLPFSVETDGTMICRFIMPFKHSALIEIENNSGENIVVLGGIRTSNFNWEDRKTMHFRARWRIDHELVAGNINANGKIYDILYLMASGKGRIVGAAAYIYNPSNSITSWGNWWGEGDEKIYVDQDTFPSLFGTGSEDYFNYSWSSARIFSYPYCGQPRNDGPGNRGYVSNFRWHILDDILFGDKLAFYMELGNHGVVPNFSYGRIVYFYALPGLIDDYQKISMSDLRDINYKTWKPIAYCGSAGFRFVQAENLIADKSSSIRIEKGKLWAEKDILVWTPAKPDEEIRFHFNSDNPTEKTVIGLTIAHCPEGGTFSIYVNGQVVKIDGRDTLSLCEPNLQILANHFTESIPLKKGKNEIILKSMDTEKNRKIRIDFFWFKETFSDK